MLTGVCIEQVAWYRNEGGVNEGSFSQKQQITFNSNGARIVATGDVDSDGIIDIISASYYDHKVGWFRTIGDGSVSAFNEL